ncbi:MAG: hypothetical protein AAB370_08735 [Verrucomicrobiota bacterium]
MLPARLAAIIRTMLFTIGKIFFPRLLHRERELRMRMLWVAVGFSVVLVIGVVAVIGYVHKTRTYSNQITKPVATSPSQPVR